MCSSVRLVFARTLHEDEGGDHVLDGGVHLDGARGVRDEAEVVVVDDKEHNRKKRARVRHEDSVHVSAR